jgi:hypothetical protein
MLGCLREAAFLASRQALYGLFVLRVLAVQDLKSHLALEELVVGEVDLGHPPAADLPDQAVAVFVGARLERLQGRELGREAWGEELVDPFGLL